MPLTANQSDARVRKGLLISTDDFPKLDGEILKGNHNGARI